MPLCKALTRTADLPFLLGFRSFPPGRRRQSILRRRRISPSKSFTRVYDDGLLILEASLRKDAALAHSTSATLSCVQPINAAHGRTQECHAAQSSLQQQFHYGKGFLLSDQASRSAGLDLCLSLCLFFDCVGCRRRLLSRCLLLLSKPDGLHMRRCGVTNKISSLNASKTLLMDVR